jgi:hypothetical protein
MQELTQHQASPDLLWDFHSPQENPNMRQTDGVLFLFLIQFFGKPGGQKKPDCPLMPYGDHHEERPAIPMSEKSQNYMNSFDDSMMETLLSNNRKSKSAAFPASGITARAHDSREDHTAFPVRPSNPGGENTHPFHVPILRSC